MIIKPEFPPNIAEIRRAFPNLKPGVVFTYGEILYAPNGGNIDNALMAHEATHTIQQGDDPDGWWSKYLEDRAFRLKQEIEAYQNQWRIYKKDMNLTPKDKKFQLRRLARDLSGPIYGYLISFDLAEDLIKEW